MCNGALLNLWTRAGSVIIAWSLVFSRQFLPSLPRPRMTRQHNDDLFKESTMTFGEHIEELRVCLFRGLMGLLVGTGIGLYFGNEVVKFITTPLENALGEFYSEQSRLKYGKWQEQRGNDDLSVEYTDAEIERITKEEGWVFDIQYVDPRRFAASIGVEGDASAGSEGLTAAKLVPVFLWKKGEVRIKTLASQEAFMIWLKSAFVFGFLVSSPWIFWQVWQFVAAGLYPHERRYVHVFLPFSIVLFLAGAALAFFVVFRYVLGFLFTFNASLQIDPDPRISEWLGFALFLPVGFGIAFQLPLVMLFLERVGIFSVAVYKQRIRIAILVMAVLSMLLTPADPMSMLLMLFPLVALYFLGIALCAYMPRRRSPFGEAGDVET